MMNQDGSKTNNALLFKALEIRTASSTTANVLKKLWREHSDAPESCAMFLSMTERAWDEASDFARYRLWKHTLELPTDTRQQLVTPVLKALFRTWFDAARVFALNKNTEPGTALLSWELVRDWMKGRDTQQIVEQCAALHLENALLLAWKYGETNLLTALLEESCNFQNRDDFKAKLLDDWASLATGTYANRVDTPIYPLEPLRGRVRTTLQLMQQHDVPIKGDATHPSLMSRFARQLKKSEWDNNAPQRAKKRQTIMAAALNAGLDMELDCGVMVAELMPLGLQTVLEEHAWTRRSKLLGNVKQVPEEQEKRSAPKF